MSFLLKKLLPVLVLLAAALSPQARGLAITRPASDATTTMDDPLPPVTGTPTNTTMPCKHIVYPPTTGPLKDQKPVCLDNFLCPTERGYVPCSEVPAQPGNSTQPAATPTPTATGTPCKQWYQPTGNSSRPAPICIDDFPCYIFGKKMSCPWAWPTTQPPPPTSTTSLPRATPTGEDWCSKPGVVCERSNELVPRALVTPTAQGFCSRPNVAYDCMKEGHLVPCNFPPCTSSTPLPTTPVTEPATTSVTGSTIEYSSTTTSATVPETTAVTDTTTIVFPTTTVQSVKPQPTTPALPSIPVQSPSKIPVPVLPTVPAAAPPAMPVGHPFFVLPGPVKLPSSAFPAVRGL